MSFDKNKLHPAVLDLQSDFRRNKITRREFLRFATLLGTSVATASVLAGCSPILPDIATPGTTGQGMIKRGGTITIGSAVQALVHPAQLSWLEQANQLRQVGEYLTETGADNITRPWLLEGWSADEDVKTWTLTLRKGIKFNNGADLTADDVIFSIEQWLNPDMGSSMATLMSYLDFTNVERVDDYTIRLYLNEAQIGVPEHLFHYPGMILPRTFEGDFLKQPIGTGPFLLDEYREGERISFRRREDYWRMGEDQQPLPYLDGVTYLDLRVDDRIAAMEGQKIDSLYSPTISDLERLENVPGLTVYTVPTSRVLVIRMRTDIEPWNDERVRLALKLCQDRAEILRRSFGEGRGDVAIDAHIAPIHPAYCEKPIPEYDLERARALLAEAGYPDGLQVTLTTKNDQGEPEMAEALRELAAPAGFDIDLNIVEPSKYWEQWTEVSLGITTWAHRPISTMMLSLAYTADDEGNPVAWNETRWVDEEFITLLRQAERLLDVEERRQIMCQMEDIMQERGPIGISFWRQGLNITRSEFKGIEAHPSSYDILYNVWKDA